MPWSDKARRPGLLPTSSAAPLPLPIREITESTTTAEAKDHLRHPQPESPFPSPPKRRPLAAASTGSSAHDARPQAAASASASASPPPARLLAHLSAASVMVIAASMNSTFWQTTLLPFCSSLLFLLGSSDACFWRPLPITAFLAVAAYTAAAVWWYGQLEQRCGCRHRRHCLDATIGAALLAGACASLLISGAGLEQMVRNALPWSLFWGLAVSSAIAVAAAAGNLNAGADRCCSAAAAAAVTAGTGPSGDNDDDELLLQV